MKSRLYDPPEEKENQTADHLISRIVEVVGWRETRQKASSLALRNPRPIRLNSDPLDLIKGDLVAPAVVKPSGAGRLVRRHLLSNFEPSAVFEISSDTGSSEGMAADLGLDPGLGSSPANHSPHIGLQHRTVGQFAAASLARAEERALTVLAYAGSGDVLLQIAVKIVVRRHLVLLAPLLMEPHPSRRP